MWFAKRNANEPPASENVPFPLPLERCNPPLAPVPCFTLRPHLHITHPLAKAYIRRLPPAP